MHSDRGLCAIFNRCLEGIYSGRGGVMHVPAAPEHIAASVQAGAKYRQPILAALLRPTKKVPKLHRRFASVV